MVKNIQWFNMASLANIRDLTDKMMDLGLPQNMGQYITQHCNLKKGA